MNETYQKVLEKMEDVDPALGQAILDRALKTVGTTPDDVTPREMMEAYKQHLQKVLTKYPSSPAVKAVKKTIVSMTAHDFGDKSEAKSAAAGSKKLPTGHITEVLYAQPNAEEPNLILSKLKEGQYETGKVWGLATVLRFTTIGEAFWNSLNRISSKTMIKLDDYSQLEDYKAWTISLITKDLSVGLQSIRYRPFANFPAAFYVKITLDGEAEVAKNAMDKVVDEIGYVPYNMNDWDAFEKKTGLTESSVKASWGKFM